MSILFFKRTTTFKRSIALIFSFLQNKALWAHVTKQYSHSHFLKFKCLAHSFKGEFAESLRSIQDNSLLKGRYPIWLSLEQQLCCRVLIHRVGVVSVTNFRGSLQFSNQFSRLQTPSELTAVKLNTFPL